MLGWGYPPNIEGGLDIHVAKLFDELRKDVHVDLALPAENAPDRKNIIGIAAGDGGMLEKSSKIANETVKIADQYDIIHTHDWFGAEAGLKAKKYSGCKWVSTLHSIAADRTRNPSDDIIKRERANEQADKLVTVSQNLQEKVKDEYGMDSIVIDNGISVPRSSGFDVRENYGVEGRLFLYIGRHAEQKGIEHLLYGFKKYLNGENATLMIGGDGHMREQLELFVEMLGIEDNVIFTGFIPNERLGDYYRAADVFVSPAISEPFGLTITEAASMGTPVIATSSGAESLIPTEMFLETEPDSDKIAEALGKADTLAADTEFGKRTWRQVADETLEL
jgi:glycosyltransferase involved in cell wall biosynthesis